jgi:hypothetical protein
MVASEQYIGFESWPGQRFYSLLQAVEPNTGHLPEKLRENYTEISIMTAL